MWSELMSIIKTAATVWWTLARSDQRRLAAAITLMAIGGLVSTVPPIVLGKLVDVLIRAQGAGFRVAVPYLGTIIGVIVLREAVQVGRKYLVENTATRVDKHTIIKVMQQVVRADAQALGADMRIGAMHGRISRSLEGLVRLLKLSFLDFLPVAFTSAFAFGAVLWKSPVLAIIMSLVVALGVPIVLHQIKSQKGIRIELLRVRDEIDGRAVELLGGLDYVKAANTGDLEVRKIEVTAEKRRRREIRHHVAMSMYDSAKYLNEGICQVLFLAVCILLSVRGAISPGDILAYAILFAAFVQPLRELHRILDEAHESSLRVADLTKVLNLPSDPHNLVSAPRMVPIENKSRPLIEIHGVSLRYPGSNVERPMALRDVSLTVNHGERLGVAGASGSGKSTLIKMLLGLVHRESGMVFVQNMPLDQMSRAQIAETFSYVSQHPFLFSGSIEENIRYGCGECTKEQIVSAAMQANIHDEIMQALGGYCGLVGERGRNLSGGQQQRIAIARVLLKKSSILLLDEATSALDVNNEDLVNQALGHAMADCTVIAVAHRSSTLANMDRIVVLEKGAVVEEGTFSLLSARRGAFYRLNGLEFSRSGTDEVLLNLSDG